MAALPPPPPPPPAAPPPFYSGVYGVPQMPDATPVARRRTGMIVLAQTLMVVKGVLWLLVGMAALSAGINMIVHGGDLHALPSHRDYPSLRTLASGLVGVAAGVLMWTALLTLAVGVADIVLGVIVGRPSNVARRLIVVLNVVSGTIALFSLIGQLNHSPTAAGVALAVSWLAANVVIFYALVIDEGSRRAFG